MADISRKLNRLVQILALVGIAGSFYYGSAAFLWVFLVLGLLADIISRKEI